MSDSPKSVLVFGSSGHIGQPAAEWLLKKAPDIKVRLASSTKSKAEEVKKIFPEAESVVANYLDNQSLVDAFDGVEAAFIITSDFLDEETAMSNVVFAAKAKGSVKRIIRLIGDPPGLREEEDVAQVLRDYDVGTAVQHLRARKVLSASGLPVTYMNVAAWFMNDFITFLSAPVVNSRTFVMPFDRMMNFIDCRDVGRTAAELLMNFNHTDVGETYHLHNGTDTMKFSDIAVLMSEVFGEKIDFDGSENAFHEKLSESFINYYNGREDAAEYFLEYCRWEHEGVTGHLAEDLLAGEVDIYPAKFGNEPRTFHQFLIENRAAFLGQ